MPDIDTREVIRLARRWPGGRGLLRVVGTDLVAVVPTLVEPLRVPLADVAGVAQLHGATPLGRLGGSRRLVPLSAVDRRHRATVVVAFRTLQPVPTMRSPVLERIVGREAPGGRPPLMGGVTARLADHEAGLRAFERWGIPRRTVRQLVDDAAQAAAPTPEVVARAEEHRRLRRRRARRLAVARGAVALVGLGASVWIRSGRSPLTPHPCPAGTVAGLDAPSPIPAPVLPDPAPTAMAGPAGAILTSDPEVPPAAGTDPEQPSESGPVAASGTWRFRADWPDGDVMRLVVLRFPTGDDAHRFGRGDAGAACHRPGHLLDTGLPGVVAQTQDGPDATPYRAVTVTGDTAVRIYVRSDDEGRAVGRLTDELHILSTARRDPPPVHPTGTEAPGTPPERSQPPPHRLGAVPRPGTAR